MEDQCSSEVPKCRNCEGAHSTSSRDCPVWKVEKEVCTVKAMEGISYYEARMRVKQTQAAPASNVSYASAVRVPPKMCTVAIQTDPSPATPTTTASPSTSASSSTKPASTTTKASSPITSSSPYLAAISKTPSKNEKDNKKDKLNLTKLDRQSHRPSHVVATPAPSRRDSHARSLSSSSGELTIDETMDFITGKGRERSPGSDQGRKKTKKHGHHHHS